MRVAVIAWLCDSVAVLRGVREWCTGGSVKTGPRV